MDFYIGDTIFHQRKSISSRFNFTISKKEDEFIGKKALEKLKKKKLKVDLMFTLKGSKPGEPLLLHDEPFI